MASPMVRVGSAPHRSGRHGAAPRSREAAAPAPGGGLARVLTGLLATITATVLALGSDAVGVPPAGASSASADSIAAPGLGLARTSHLKGREPPGQPGGLPEVAAGSTPVTSGYFNDPLGTPYQRRRLVRYLIRTIDAVPSGSEIRLANYSFADWDTGLALLRAYERGVRVKVIVPDNRQFNPVDLLRKHLGSNPERSSFVVTCHFSCRGRAGSMHAKFFQFGRAGGASYVSMFGSLNLTKRNTNHQWSDLYTMTGNRGAYLWLENWFKEMKYDRPVRHAFRARYRGPTDLFVTPIALRYQDDPIQATLRNVQCAYRTSSGWHRTALLISTHAWNGTRGKRIADSVADLQRRGCRPRVYYGEGMGGGVMGILRRAGVPLSNGRHSGQALAHLKLLVVVGSYANKANSVRVLTGSQNWSDRATRRDDLMGLIDNRAVGRQYVRNYWYMWNQG